MQEVIGQALILIMKLLKEYNEEFVEQNLEERSMKEEDVKPDEWYPVEKTINTLEKLSDDANQAVGKLIVVMNSDVIKELKLDATPKNLISLLKPELSKFFKGENVFSLMTAVDSGTDFLVVKTKIYPFTESFVKGVILGFLQLLKIKNVHIVKTDEDDFQIFTVKWQ